MTLKLDTIKRLYLLLAVFYYCGFMGFFTRLFTGKSEGSIESTASGDVLKQIVGIEILIIGLILLLTIRFQKIKSIVWRNKVWVILLVFSMASVIWSEVQGVSLRRFIAFFTLVTCCFVLAYSFEIRSLLLYLSEAIVTAAILGLFMIIVAPDIALVDKMGGERASTFYGIFFEKNAGARCYAYAILIRFAYGKFRTNIDILKLSVLFSCAVLAKSATAIVIILIGIGVIAALNSLYSSQRNVRFNRVFFITCLGALSIIIINYAFEAILELLGRDPTLTNRAIIWELLTPFVENKLLLGYGFNSFWASNSAQAFVDRWGFIGNAHSGYYEALLSGGIVCLLIVFLLIFKVLKDCLHVYIYTYNGRVITPVLAIILIQAVVNYVGFLILNYNSTDMFFFTVLSFAASVVAFEGRRQT